MAPKNEKKSTKYRTEIEMIEIQTFKFDEVWVWGFQRVSDYLPSWASVDQNQISAG